MQLQGRPKWKKLSKSVKDGRYMEAISCALASTFKEIFPSILKFQPHFPELEWRFPKMSISLSEIEETGSPKKKTVQGVSQKEKEKRDLRKRKRNLPTEHVSENIPSGCVTSLAYFWHSLQMPQQL